MITRVDRLFIDPSGIVSRWLFERGHEPAIHYLTSLRSIEDRFTFCRYAFYLVLCRCGIRVGLIPKLRIGDWNPQERLLTFAWQRNRSIKRRIDVHTAHVLTGWAAGRVAEEPLLLESNGHPISGARRKYWEFARQAIGRAISRYQFKALVAYYAFNHGSHDQPKYLCTHNKRLTCRRVAIQHDTELLAERFADTPLPGLCGSPRPIE